MSKIARISDITHKSLDKLSKETGESRQSLIDKAVEKLRRELFLKKCDEEYQEFQKDEAALQEELKERELWETTLLDGLEDDD